MERFHYHFQYSQYNDEINDLLNIIILNHLIQSFLGIYVHDINHFCVILRQILSLNIYLLYKINLVILMYFYNML